MEFLLEGLLLATIAGTGGILLVGGLAALVNSFPMPAFFAGLPINRMMVIHLALILGAIGVFSALPPAWRASRLTPVEALTFEK